jgi:hypothetical protein
MKIKVAVAMTALLALIVAGIFALALMTGTQPIKDTFTEVTQSLETRIDLPLKDVTPEMIKESISSTTANIPEAGIPLRDLKIEATQEKALEAVGIDPTTFVISKEMLVCAEQTLGAKRVSDFVGGESPTVIEMGKLLPCLNAS